MAAQRGPLDGPLRAVRAAALALSVTSLAGLGHLAGGGSPAPVPLLAGFVLVYAVASLLARRRLRLPVIIAVLALGQVALHLLLTVSASHSGMPGMSSGAHSLMITGPMITAHLLATAVSAVLLRHGEHALWLVWGLLTRLLVTAPVRVRATPRAVLVPVSRTERARRNRYDAVRRGPPGAPTA